MLVNSRVIWSDNGTLVDISKELTDLFAGTKTLTSFNASQDKLYFGCDVPFNHRYIQIGTANAVASVASVKVLTSSGFVSAVDVLDFTSSGGATLAQNGILQWALDRDTNWLKKDTEDIAELTSLRIFDMYWAELTLSVSPTSTLSLKYVGHKFSDDNSLAGRYPDLVRSKVLTAFASGKTDWHDQHVLAAEEVIQTLRGKQKLVSSGQIFGWEIFNDAANHKVAQIILNSMGDDYSERRDDARRDFHAAMNLPAPMIDRDQDGRLDSEDKTWSVGLTRV